MRRQCSSLLTLVSLFIGLFLAGCGPATAGIARTSDGSPPGSVSASTGSTPTPSTTSTQAAAIATATHPPRRTPAPTPTSVLSAHAPASFASRALARTNAYRSQFNCPPLHENAQLDQAALAHSQDMATHGYFDHKSPAGQTPWDRIHAAGYQFSQAAENIVAGYATPEAVIDAFFHETPPNDGHRRNLLNCALRDIGFGYFSQPGSAYGSYWTQDFATPL